MKRKHLLLVLLMSLALPLAMWGQKTLPYEYGFENNDLSSEGWTRNSMSSNTNISSNAKRTGNYGFRFYYNADPQCLISPELSTTTSGVTVEFYYKTSSTYFQRTFQVGYSTTTTDVGAFTFGDEITASDAEWALFGQDFPAGTKYVAIKHENTSYGNLYLDDFIFEECSEFPTPKNLVMTTYTSSTATLDWTGRTGQDHWDIYYSTSEAAPDSGTTPQVSNTETKPYTLSGLTPGETYYAYVRGNYNNGEHYSDWSNACTFEVGCFTPTIGESMATCNQAYFSWIPVGSETSWQVAFSDQQGFDPNAVTPETVTLQYYVHEDLATGVTYYAHVRAVCGEGDYSDWSEEVSMTTECFAPSNLQESSVTPTTATLSWTQGSNESQWQISYSTTANFTPENGTVVTVSSKPYTLSGLTLNTQYYAYVRAVCGENIYSDWSDICAFMPKYELTVGNGMNYNAYIPIGASAIDYTTKSQFIIPAAELDSLLYANISKMTFYATSETGNMGTATFDVLISELNNVTTFENYAFFDWSEMTTVYSGSLSVSESKMEITLTAPYQYMGGDLLIGFTQTVSGTTSGYYGWYGAETTGYCAYGGYEMTAYNYTSYSRYKFMPKTTFSYTPGTTPTCMKPSNLNISQTSGSATFTWTAGDEETHWNVQYKEASASEWSTVIIVEDTPTCTLNNLSPITSYQVRVQADCGGGDTSGWIAGAFTTSCGPTNAPYSHDFDSDATGSSAAFPQCWTKVNDSDDPSYNYFPYITTGNSHSGLNCLFFMRLYDYTALNQIAVFPEMNADVRTLQLSFYARLGSGTNQPLSVGVMTDPDDATTFVKIEDVTIASSEYAQYTVSFDEYEGTGHYIALKCERANVYNQIYVDDVEVTANSVCFAPENPQISDVTAHSAVFTWTPGSDVSNWQVQYKKASDTDWSESIAVSGTASYTLGNLLAATEYVARVRTVCGTDDYSDWVASEAFTIDCDYMSLPYSYGFEDDEAGTNAPTCWHFNGGYYPRINNGSAHSGTNCLLINQNSNNAVNYVVLPEINTAETPINTLRVTFWGKRFSSDYYQYSYFDYFSLGVMTDPNDVSTFEFIIGTSMNMSNKEYKLFELFLENYTGEGTYLAIRYNGSPMYYIDDIEVAVAPTCMAPLDLSSNTTYAHEAYISWKARKAEQLDYQVSYSTEEGFDPAEGTIVDVHFDSPLSGTMYRDYQLTCLNAETTYYFYVRTQCGENEYSDWSADYSSFTTDLACPAPYINDIHPKHTVADIYWYGNEDDEWEFQYKESSSDEWITPTDFSPIMGAELSLVYRLTGLTPDTDYDIRIRQHCGMYSCPEVDDGYSDWATDYFTTGSGCWNGTPWMCTSHLGTQAALNWRNDAEASRWQIRYRLESEDEYPEENIVTTNVLPEASLQKYVVTGLQPNSTYYWEVRGYCDETSQGEWSLEDYFFTHSTDGFITVDKTHPYYEDFEDGMPADWGRMNLYNFNMDHYDTWECITATSGTWEALPATQCISSCRECMSWASTGSMILMPAIYIDENATSAVLSFWSKDAYNASDARGTKMIWVNGNYLSTEYTAFDLGCVYQKGSTANYWRQCFVNLDDYIGDTVIIAFDYVVAHNYNNYDWWVDNVRVEVFDNVFGGGSEVTEGNWDDPNMWGNGGSRSGGLPTADDNVLISAKVTIPEGFIAEANRIVLNLDTIADVKYGNIFIANGGQLKVNDEVEVTMERAVSGYGRGGNGWYLIAPPVQEALKPESDSIADVLDNNYDLYSFDGSYQGEEWRNYKQDEDDFTFENGYGYLFANSASVSPSFKGTMLPSNQTKTVDLDFAATTFGGWNLVGNPFTCDAYLQDGRNFYRMNEGGTALTLASGVIHPMEGVFVEATDDDQSVIFTTTEPTRGQGMNFSLRKADMRSADAIDRARILFGEGQNLGHLDLIADPNRLYIPMSGKELAVVSTQPVGELPLNFEAAANGTYTLDFEDETEGLMYCHLIDHLTGADVDLLALRHPSTGSGAEAQGPASYTFNARTTDYPSRFKVVFVANGPSTPSTGSGAEGSATFAFMSNGNWVIANEGRATLQVIDVNGRILSSEQINGCVTINVNETAGIYMLRLVNGENVKVQKVVVR